MRRVRAAIVVVALSVLSVAFAGQASAGGPTSVLLVEPDTRVATSLYYTDAEYDALASLVGAGAASGLVGEVDRSGASHEFGSGITLTWLVHDVAVWRVDRIFVDAKGGPWISTQLVMNDSGNVYDSPVVWHAAADGPALTALLERIGFGAGAKSSTGGTPADDVEAFGNAPAVPVDEPAARPAADSASGTAGWVWGLAGLTLGIALAVAALRVLPTIHPLRTSRASAEPDRADASLPRGASSADAADADADDERAWTVPDELSWAGAADLARRG